MESFVCFWSGRTGRRTVAGGGGRAHGMREAPLAVRIRHRDRRTRGTTLSLQGPHGGDTANTILNNPVGRTDTVSEMAQGFPWLLGPHTRTGTDAPTFMFPTDPRAGMGESWELEWKDRHPLQEAERQLGRMTGLKGANIPAGLTPNLSHSHGVSEPRLSG